MLTILSIVSFEGEIYFGLELFEVEQRLTCNRCDLARSSSTNFLIKLKKLNYNIGVRFGLELIEDSSVDI